MTMQLSLGILLGIIIGAVAVALTISVFVIIISQRVKHRRLMALTNAAGERRISRYPGGNVSITDEDTTTKSGTGKTLQSILHTPQKRSSTCRPMSSREDVEDVTYLKDLSSRSLESTKPDPQQSTFEASFNLPPRRLRRVDGHPMIELHCTTMASAEGANKTDKGDRMDRAREGNFKMADASSGYKSAIASANPAPIADSDLTPKPLFHERHRSISDGKLPEYAEARRSIGLGSSESSKKSGLPRSVSLCSQEASLPPARPVPTLPPEAVAISRQRSLAGIRASLRYSSSGPNLGEGLRREAVLQSRVEPVGNSGQARASATSAAFTLPKIAHCNDLESSIRIIREDVPKESVARAGGNSSGAEKTRVGRTPHDYQQTLQTGIRSSFSRGRGERAAGPQVDNVESHSTLVWEPAKIITVLEEPSSKTKEPRILAVNSTIPPAARDALPVSRESSSHTSETSSTCISQASSGKEQSPPKSRLNHSVSTPPEQQPREEVIKTPEAQKVKKLEPTGRALNRNALFDASKPAVAIPKLMTPLEKENWYQAKMSNVRTLQKPRDNPPTFRPPSRSTFEPELSTAILKASSATSQDSHSKTLAKLSGYDDFDSSPNSDLSTPTRKPIRVRPTASHPNRQKPIFDSMNLTQWPLAGQHPTLSLGLRGSISEDKTNIFHVDAQPNGSQELDRQSHRPGLTYRFPSPPSIFSDLRGLDAGQCRQPRKPPLRGPRTPSWNPHGPRQSRMLPNPTATFVNISPDRADRLSTDLAATDLRKSIIALRRMNSSITDYAASPYKNHPEKRRAGNQEHRRYLSLSNRDSRLFEAAADTDVKSRIQAMACAEDEGRRARRKRRGSSSTAHPATNGDIAEVSEDQHGDSDDHGPDVEAEKKERNKKLPTTTTMTTKTSTAPSDNRAGTEKKQLKNPRTSPSILDMDLMAGFHSEAFAAAAAAARNNSITATTAAARSTQEGQKTKGVELTAG